MLSFIRSLRLPSCAFCDEPVEPITAATDENGKTVHEDCFVRKRRLKEITPPSAALVTAAQGCSRQPVAAKRRVHRAQKKRTFASRAGQTCDSCSGSVRDVCVSGERMESNYKRFNRAKPVYPVR
jgi:hypothetical protein